MTHISYLKFRKQDANAFYRGMKIQAVQLSNLAKYLKLAKRDSFDFGLIRFHSIRISKT